MQTSLPFIKLHTDEFVLHHKQTKAQIERLKWFWMERNRKRTIFLYFPSKKCSFRTHQDFVIFKFLPVQFLYWGQIREVCGTIPLICSTHTILQLCISEYLSKHFMFSLSFQQWTQFKKKQPTKSVDNALTKLFKLCLTVPSAFFLSVCYKWSKWRLCPSRWSATPAYY